MGKIVFVELLDRRGNVRERVRVDSFPATVGRGYANAVIVDDPLVSAEHLRLSLDSEGGVIVEDLNTVNGTRLSTSRERIERHRVPAGGEAVLRIGQTVLRLRGDDFAVGPATSSRPCSESSGRFIENGVIAFLVFVAGFGLYVLAFAQGIRQEGDLVRPDRYIPFSSDRLRRLDRFLVFPQPACRPLLPFYDPSGSIGHRFRRFRYALHRR